MMFEKRQAFRLPSRCRVQPRDTEPRRPTASAAWASSVGERLCFKAERSHRPWSRRNPTHLLSVVIRKSPGHRQNDANEPLRTSDRLDQCRKAAYARAGSIVGLAMQRRGFITLVAGAAAAWPGSSQSISSASWAQARPPRGLRWLRVSSSACANSTGSMGIPSPSSTGGRRVRAAASARSRQSLLG
jgi:hypothetical protein